MSDGVDLEAGTPTAFGILHARVRSADGEPVLVEVLRPASYDRLVGARDALRGVQGRHVVRVLDVVRQRAGTGHELCAVVRPGFAFTGLPGSLPCDEAVRLVADVLLGLADVHDAGLTHGAVDRRAVLLDRSVPLRPTVRLVGHGLAALLTDRRPSRDGDVAAAAALLGALLPPGSAVSTALAAALDGLPGLDARAAAARLGAVRSGGSWLRRSGGRAAAARPPTDRQPATAGEPPAAPVPTGWLPPAAGQPPVG